MALFQALEPTQRENLPPMFGCAVADSRGFRFLGLRGLEFRVLGFRVWG